MRTQTTRTTRAAVVLSGAVAALLLGGATAPAAYAEAPGKAHGSHGKAHGSHGKKAGHAKKASAKSTGDRKAGGDNRSSSNKDGKGHNDQWQAQADPDGMENGGIDQPGGTGGYDPVGWDGNNGTGNDPDCEDDNRGKGVPGHCKDRPGTPAQAPGDTTPPTQTPNGPKSEEESSTPEATDRPSAGGTDTVVLGIDRMAGPTAAGRAPAAVEAAEVAPAAEATGVLPNTGADAAMLAMLAGGVAAAGAGTVLVRRGRATQS